MYSKEFRDKVYKEQNDNPPRTATEHKENAINRLDEHLPENVKWLNILDYASWPGDIWWAFLKKWANVDFAEISSTMIDTLRKKFCYKNELWDTLDEKQNWWHAKVFSVESPKDLPVEDWSYDYIIARALFHHVSPGYWKDFLDKFWKLLTSDWKMIIAWWDETDVVLKQDNFKGHVTWQPSYNINDLPIYLDQNIFDIEETWLIDEKIPAFDIPRTLRYYVVKHK